MQALIIRSRNKGCTHISFHFPRFFSSLSSLFFFQLGISLFTARRHEDTNNSHVTKAASHILSLSLFLLLIIIAFLSFSFYFALPFSTFLIVRLFTLTRVFIFLSWRGWSSLLQSKNLWFTASFRWVVPFLLLHLFSCFPGFLNTYLISFTFSNNISLWCRIYKTA